MNPSFAISVTIILLCSTVITEIYSFKVASLRSSSSTTALYATTKSMKPTADEFDLAYQCWMELNDGIPATAPAYLTKEACNGKFQNLVNAVYSVDGALEMLKSDPGVLRFREETVVGSYAAWVRKFDGDETKAMELCIRAPMILALKEKVVDATKPSDLSQTIFFSYFAVAFRGPTKFLQMLIKPLFKL